MLASAVMLVAISGRYLFAEWLNQALAWATAKTETTWDDRIAAALTPPLTFLPIAIGVFLATQALNMSGLPGGVAESLAQTLFAGVVFWALLRLIEPAADAIKPLKSRLTPTMVLWGVRATRVFVWLVAAATILELWGVRVLPIIAGLGLIGVAVALGAQDLFKNLISGLLILTERRFKVGDWVKVDGVVEGTVEDIGFRSTKVRQFDKAPVYVPNAAFADGAVVNFGEMTNRRIFWKIGLEYRTTAAQLRAIREKVEAALSQDERFRPSDEVAQFVRLDAFSDSSIDLMIYAFTRTTNWGEYLAIKEDFLLTVKEIVEAEGAGFAFPSTSLYVEKGLVEKGAAGRPATSDSTRRAIRKAESAAAQGGKTDAGATAGKGGADGPDDDMTVIKALSA
ncbi:MAG: mechanosensitive ion channel family protein [Pseudomonadota bacterium]